MNRMEIKAQMARLGLRLIDVADATGITIYSLVKKLKGEVKMSDGEKAALADTLHLTPQQTRDWICDEGNLALFEKLNHGAD